MARWDRNRALPKHCYARGNKIWFRFRNENGDWQSKKTRFTLDQVEQAQRYVANALKLIKRRREKDPVDQPLTVRLYAERWLKDREARGICSLDNDKLWLNVHALPVLGDIRLDDLKSFHIRDLVRRLESKPIEDRLSPRSILHVYSTLHNMMENAVDEELLMVNPVRLRRGELPKKVDKDPEWRLNATYTVNEVERLISDPVIPPERRVQYALKAIAGLRHGEVAALRWRQVDHSFEPLGKLKIVHAFDSKTCTIKRPKNEEPRDVPIHQTLAKILAAWKLMWANVYGRHPAEDDFVVPARTFRPIRVMDAWRAMLRDFATLGIRDMAGKVRHRGGHDLRSWYKTRCIEDQGDSLIIRRTTHAPPKDVNAGYERFSWEAVCREVSKLKISVLEGQVLELATASLQAQKKAGARWNYAVTTAGRQPVSPALDNPTGSDSSTVGLIPRGPTGSSRATIVARLATELEIAIRDADLQRALAITRRLRHLDAAARPEVAQPVATKRRTRV